MTDLRAAIDAAMGGAGRLVLLSGEPGIGKTRTAQQAATYARERGAQVLWGRCYEGEGAPAFWPWIEVLRGATEQFAAESLREAVEGAADIGQLLPALGTRLPGLPEPIGRESAEARFRLFDAVTTFTARLARRTPLVVIIDDLHGADRSSLLLLEFFSRAVRQMPLLMLATYRSVETRSENGLRDSLVELGREMCTQRVELHGLTRDDIERIVRKSSGAPVANDLIDLLHERTEGNPLFLEEFIRMVMARNGTAAIDVVRLRSATPRSVRAVIEARLAALSTPCRDVLCAASVIGREFSGQLLAAMQPRAIPSRAVTERDLHALLEEAEASGAISSSSETSGRWRFRHALIRETLYDGIRPAERAELHRRAGQALERRPAIDEHLAELAHHYSAAGTGQMVPVEADVAKAIAYARRAGERAMALLAYEEAVRLYRVALAVLESTTSSSDATTRCEILLELGCAQRECDLESSKETLSRAAELAKQLGLREQLSRAALSFGTKIGWGERAVIDYDLVRLLQEAVDVWGQEDSVLHARLLARLAPALRLPSESEYRLSVTRTALEMARRLGDQRVLAEAIHTWLAINLNPDNLGERMALSNEMAHHAEQVHETDLTALAYAWRYLHLVELGDWQAAREQQVAAERLVETLRDPYHRWVHEFGRAMLAIHAGDFTAAEGCLQESLKLEQVVTLGPPLGSMALLSDLWVTQGRRHNLEALAQSMENTVGPLPQHVQRSLIAFLASELDRGPQAREEFEKLAVNDFEDFPRDVLWLRCMYRLAEVCAFVRDPSRAQIMQRLLAPYETRAVVNPVTKLYYGPVSYALGLLETTLSQWDAASAHFEYALEMDRQARARPQQARTQYEYARMLQQRGGPGDAEHAQGLLAAALATARELDMPLLQERIARCEFPVADVTLRPAVERNTARKEATAGVFRREGQFWTVGYDDKIVRLKDSKGVRYLAHLLRHPGQELLALDLVQGADVRGQGAGSNREPAARDGGLDVIDAQARSEYRRRVQELRGELEEAERFNDLGRVQKLKDELDFVARQLTSGVGLHGSYRKTGGAAERARLMVTKRIKSVLTMLDSLHPSLAHHLRACVKTGSYCSYTPPPNAAVVWTT